MTRATIERRLPQLAGAVSRTRAVNARRAAGDGRCGWLAAVALAAATVVAWPFAGALQYDRDRVIEGELWRLATCQWTHWSPDHLIWDGLVFLALGIAAGRRGSRATLGTIGISAVLVPLAVHRLCPAIDTFRGLSGIDSALFGLLAAWLALGGRRRDAAIAGVALIGFAAKVGYESATGETVFARSSGTFAVVPLAHGVGCLIGATIGFVSSRRFRKADASQRVAALTVLTQTENDEAGQDVEPDLPAAIGGCV